MSQTQQHFHSDKPFVVREKRLSGAKYLQVYDFAFIITERNNKFMFYIPEFYEKTCAFREFQKVIMSKYTTLRGSDREKELVNKYGNGKKGKVNADFKSILNIFQILTLIYSAKLMQKEYKQ